MNKIRLVIISERTRYHFQKPLEYFHNIEIFHLYKHHYPDMDPKDFGSNLIRYKNIFELYKILKKLKPDLIQGLEPYYGYSRFKIPIKVLPILATTYFYCQNTKTPYFFHILENIPPQKKYGRLAGRLMKKIAYLYSKKARFIFYLNKGARQNLLSLKINHKKIFYGLWGIWGLDIKQFSPLRIKIKKEKSKIILFAGRLINQKGWEDLLEAIKIIIINSQAPITNFKLVIAGDGPDKEKLKLKIKKLKLKKYITLVGQVPNEMMPAYFRVAWVTVSPSYSLFYSAEQIGMSNLESMACGTPVISTFSGSISEYVLNGKTGILVPEKEPRALAQAIVKILRNKKLREKLSKNCRAYILKNFDAKKNVRKLEKFVLNQIQN